MVGEWYYKVMGQEVGPVSTAELKDLAESGFLAPDVLVRKGAKGDWTPADQWGGLFEGSFEAESQKPSRGPPADAGGKGAGTDDVEAPSGQPASPLPPSPPKPADAEWYCRVMDKEIGPLSRTALGELAASGFLAPGALVRQGVDGGWIPAGEVKGLFSQPPKSAEKPDLAGAEPVSAESPVPVDKRRDSPRQAEPPSPSRPRASQVGWYCEVMGEQTGPLSSAQLKELAASGFLTPDVAVRKGVEGKWVPARRVKGLFPEASRAPGEKKAASPPTSRPQSQPSSGSDLRAKPAKRSAKPAASRPPAAQIVWYYRAMSEEIGPLSSADLQELAKSGLLTPDTPIRAGTDGEWVAAGRVLGLFDEPSEGAPGKKAKRSAGPVPPQPASPSDPGGFLDPSLMVPLPDKPKSAAPSPEAGRPAQGAKRTRLRGSP